MFNGAAAAVQSRRLRVSNLAAARVHFAPPYSADSQYMNLNIRNRSDRTLKVVITYKATDSILYISDNIPERGWVKTDKLNGKLVAGDYDCSITTIYHSSITGKQVMLGTDDLTITVK